MTKIEKNKNVLHLIADRSAVFFIGVSTGVLIGLSFYADGKLGSIFQQNAPAVVAKPLPLPSAARECIDTFPVSPRVIDALRSNRPLRIGVFGDSFGDGVWAGTLQEFRGNKGVEIFRFSKQSTGFTRYKSLDLYEDTKRIISEQHIDIGIISFGANDTQGVWSEGRAEEYMSPGWQKTVGDRATSIVKLLHDDGVAVGWVGLPPMRKASFDAQIQQMNNFYANLMCSLNVPFVDPVSVTRGPDGKFSKELVDPVTGKKYIARADDGIHMSVHGYQVITRPLLQRVAAFTDDSQTADGKREGNVAAKDSKH